MSTLSTTLITHKEFICVIYCEHMTIQFDEDKQDKRVEDLYRKEEEELALVLAQKYELEYRDLTRTPVNTNALRLVPEEMARTSKVAGFELVGKKLSLAILSPRRQEVENQISDLERRGYIVKTFIVSTASLEHAWGRYQDLSFAENSREGTLNISAKDITETMGLIHNINDVRSVMEDILAMNKSFRVSRIVEVLMAGGIAIDASDIHVEPEEDFVGVRYRVDGVLTRISNIDHETHKLLLSRIKLLSGLKLNIKDAAQDGRFSVDLESTEIEIRTSTLPGAYGEAIVMRLLNPESIQVEISELGIPENLMHILEREVDRPKGLILNTGPTGSGKTTTLYAFLQKKRGSDIKIITIEDPIEYHLEGIVQTQVDKKKGYDFASGLRASLRQDPDVIMVGEIRDKETAEIAIQSALTGHLVFSTLHTNTAAGAFPRLIDLGVNPKILSSAINISIAQRLVRRLCPECKKEVEIPKDKVDLLKYFFDTTPKNDIPTFPNTMFKAVGCSACNTTGYKGRVGVYEAVLSDEKIETILQANPSEREIRKAAHNQGIASMQQDGINKILKGITTLDELERVIDLEKE